MIFNNIIREIEDKISLAYRNRLKLLIDNKNYIHLHNHSEFSVLDGLSKPAQIVDKAIEQGCKSVAITDHGSISAMPVFYDYAVKKGIKPIIGVEFYCCDELVEGKIKYTHLTVLAKNWNGVQSIMRQLTLANKQFYRKPRLTFEQALNFENCITMSACVGGLFYNKGWRERVYKFQERYGEDFYIEIMPHVVNENGYNLQKMVNNRAIWYAKKFGVKLIATGDSHYIDLDDRVTHEVLLAIQSRAKWDQKNRFGKGFPNAEMKDYHTMLDGFISIGVNEDVAREALDNTHLVADKCNVEIPNIDIHLPYLNCDQTITEEDKDILAKDEFLSKIKEGWGNKIVGGGYDEKKYKERLIEEIRVIEKLGFIRYFLIVEDFIRYAKDNGIVVGPGRGSAAGSLVCWLMGITQVDPIRHGLFFSRFLNENRVSLPDIDVDFEKDRREEVFQYIMKRYGEDKTSHIGTFGFLTCKSAFRDVCSVFGIPPYEFNQLSKLIDDEEALDTVPELIRFGERNPHIIEHVRKLNGVLRNVGTHAAGVVVSNDKITDVGVIEHRKDSEVVCWDKRSCEDKFGLLKVDVLGLSTLTVLNMAKRLIKEHKGVDIVFEDISLEDEKTLEMFRVAKTIGIFQYEQKFMRNLLKDVDANDFETVTACSALYRPGPLESGITEEYKQIKQGKRRIQYDHPILEPVLKDTYGLMYFQESAMAVSMIMGGFTESEADEIRKVMGKKDTSKLPYYREKFVSGAVKKGIEKWVAEKVFDKMEKFAGYLFNYSHAVAYTMISFWSAYLKAHYPLEYMTALLNCTTKEDNIPRYVREVRRIGIEFTMPDINLSERDYKIVDGKIVIPFKCVHGVGEKALDYLTDARRGGKFESLEDFRSRVYKRVINKRVVDNLIKAGCFESLGVREEDEEVRHKNFMELISVYDIIPSLDVKQKIDKDGLAELYGRIGECARGHAKTVMERAGGAYPAIMVINQPVKREKKNLGSSYTKLVEDELNRVGLKKSNIYYTSPVKCYHELKNYSKTCTAKCYEFLKEEIGILKPRLIVVCDWNIAHLFVTGKPKKSDYLNRLIFNAEYGSYVLFTHSPQYASMKGGTIREEFDKTFDIVGEIFS